MENCRIASSLSMGLGTSVQLPLQPLMCIILLDLKDGLTEELGGSKKLYPSVSLKKKDHNVFWYVSYIHVWDQGMD